MAKPGPASEGLENGLFSAIVTVMSDATYIPGQFARPAGAAKPVIRPKPQPLATPVFIHDCVTPLGGETVLSLLMKRLARDVQDE